MEAPVTLITGTRKGIGRSLSERYLELGHVVIGCSRQGSDLVHERYVHHCVDVADERGVQELFLDTKNRFGRLDNLINNAGIASMNHAMLVPMSTVRTIFETNVFGTFLFCREASRLMAKAKKGRIVNFATVATPLRLEGESVYAASKAAVVSLTEILAREFASMNITVNGVGPTPVDTDLIKGVPKEKMDALLNRQAIKRFGTFEDVANVVDFFLRPESDFVTGQTIYLGGV